jgi:hypothetical protein
MKKKTPAAKRVTAPTQLLPVKDQPNAVQVTLKVVSKSVYTPFKMPPVQEGQFKGRDGDCL